MSVSAVVVFVIVFLGGAQPGGAQSTSTAAGEVAVVKELYGMKLVRSLTVAREIWVNSNSYPVTAVWNFRSKHFDSVSNKTVETKSQLRPVFKAKEQREVSFGTECVGFVIIMAYKDENDRMIQGNAAADWTPQSPDVP
jgi:hypothetical protein